MRHATVYIGKMIALQSSTCFFNVERFSVMTLNSQSEEAIHFQSESANKRCASFKTNVERFCMIRSTANQKCPFTIKVNQPI